MRTIALPVMSTLLGLSEATSAQRLKRVFGIVIETCEACGGEGQLSCWQSARY